MKKELEAYTHTPGRIAVTQRARGTGEKLKPPREELASRVFPLKPQAWEGPRPLVPEVPVLPRLSLLEGGTLELLVNAAPHDTAGDSPI